MPPSADQQSLNDLRHQSLVAEFRRNIGNRILVLIASFPFFYVGELVDVESDTVFVQSEFSNVPVLDNVILRTHIDNIQVYFIEAPGTPIPEIRL
ncbi:hypothetical protein JJQ72_18765 [Paenibacillus sp. F411]|uniref:hypothetical protein n=1 Tax=Paenibacillus sp. F411 TaxID=2820239 RepID=UPI001AAF0F06|nr:hypothetical protein [Paenibacillus sp. F411]MBO2946025.1 hypothetical protein [Paenibacillus sp. F411]